MQFFIINDIKDIATQITIEDIIAKKTITTKAEAIIASDTRNVTSMLFDYDFAFVDNALKDFILYLKEVNIMHFSK
jgi:hypothetical protein